MRGKWVFFSVWHIFCNIQIWKCTFYNTKGMGREKHSVCTKRLGKCWFTWGFFFCVFKLFFIFYFWAMKDQGYRWTRVNKTFYKEPECKGMHNSTNCVASQSLNTTIVLNGEFSNYWQNFYWNCTDNSILVVVIKIKSFQGVLLNDSKKYST